MRRRIFKGIDWDGRFRNVEDILFYSHCLAKYKARVVDFPICKVIHHSGSLRHDVDGAASLIDLFVEVLFSKGSLPKELYPMKRNFHAMRHLSASRLYLIQGETLQGRAQFWKAVKTAPKMLFKVAYLKKYIKSFL